MSEQTTFGSWWPFTLAGAARFSQRPLGVLLILQASVACVGAAAVIFYFQRAWSPLVPEAITRLPKAAFIAQKTLHWPKGNDSTALSHNPLAALIIDLPLNGKAGQLSDVQLEFGTEGWRIRSLFGFLDFGYQEARFDLDPAILLPMWGAWKPAYIAALGAGTALVVFLSWIIIATLGAPFAKLVAFFADRDLTITQAWKLCGAALMPGALFFSASIALYALSRLNLLSLLLAALIHLFIDAAYILLAPCRLQQREKVEPGLTLKRINPFKGTGSED